MISGRVAVVAAGGLEGSRPSAIVGGSKTVSVSAVANARRGVATSPAVLGPSPGAEAAPDRPGALEDEHRRERAERKAGTVRWVAPVSFSGRRAPPAEGVVLFIPPGDRRLLVVALRVGVLGHDLGRLDG